MLASYDSQVSSADLYGFYESLPIDGSGRDRLGSVQRSVAAICDLRQEVNSGGFDTYFRYWGGDTALDALSAIGEVLGPAWGELLRKAMLTLGPDYPTDANIRFEKVDEPQVQAALDRFDSEYFELENTSDADGVLAAHLAQA